MNGRAGVPGADRLSRSKSPATFMSRGSHVYSSLNYIKITLTAADDYTVECFKLRGIKFSAVSKCEGVYADMLRSVFEQTTGLYTSLGLGGGR